MTTDTIIAPSTPPGVSGLAIIRISGSACQEVLLKALNCERGESHIMKYGRFLDVRTGEMLDRLNYVFMAAPKTSTGEDVLELFPHGNPLLIKRILESVLSNKKIRMAEPGEFTRRALEHGKLDLTQAEGLLSFIHAGNEYALKNARQVMNGALSKPLAELKATMDSLSAQLELDVDFVEEEDEPDYQSWKPLLENIKDRLHTLLDSWEIGKRLNYEPKVAFFGKPNAGKSSLINTLIKQDRLLVSTTPGTTRDYVEVPVNLESGRVVLVDTAGIGDSEDVLNDQVRSKTEEMLQMADFKIWVTDGTANDQELNNSDEFDLWVSNKSDMNGFIPGKGLSTSAVNGEGISELLHRLNQVLLSKLSGSEDAVLVSERQYFCIKMALENLNNALSVINQAPAVEILAFELRQARNELDNLLGRYSPDDTLNTIFSHFCIGK
ncbi:MAG: tRNA uridine-5-carboxymethylaminomethyl(34) synthesis GTPase MnmE [Fibrobacteria bacterium]|nr:tRNA uridine-5-carboxymethylaminomethyl(34) synthesis GTPase MnmE [Fibrobacteria bacterium]